MAPNPEDRLGGSDGLEFEPVKTRPMSKRHWGRWVSFSVFIVVSSGGGWYYFGDQFPIETGKQIPVIRADVTPVKIKPADPGGMEILDRDILVYDRLNSEGGGTTYEHLLPPPETPIPMPMPKSQLQEAPSETASAPPPTEPMISESAPTKPQLAIAQMAVAATDPAATVAPGDENSPVALQPSTVMETPAEAAAETTIKTTDAPLAPPPPPAPVAPVEAAPVTPTPLQPASTQVAVTQSTTNASTAKVNEHNVQLAALRTHERAETEWKRQKKAHPDILGALKFFVVRVDLGGDKGVFFRLRAGPLKDAAAAKTLCSELAKRNVGCLVIRPGK